MGPWPGWVGGGVGGVGAEMIKMLTIRAEVNESRYVVLEQAMNMYSLTFYKLSFGSVCDISICWMRKLKLHEGRGPTQPCSLSTPLPCTPWRSLGPFSGGAVLVGLPDPPWHVLRCPAHMPSAPATLPGPSLPAQRRHGRALTAPSLEAVLHHWLPHAGGTYCSCLAPQVGNAQAEHTTTLAPRALTAATCLVMCLSFLPFPALPPCSLKVFPGSPPK